MLSYHFPQNALSVRWLGQPLPRENAPLDQSNPLSCKDVTSCLCVTSV